MTNEERQELCNDLRLYIPTHSRLYQAAAELERLAGTLQTTLVMYGQQQKRLSALAQSNAEPSQDMRDRLAIYLMALDECGMGDNPQTHEGFFTNYLSEQRNSEHSGDCKKEPWTCIRCVCDEYLLKADHLLTAFPALAQSDAERPDIRRILDRLRFCENCL